MLVSSFPFSKYWWFYALFILFIGSLLILDLGIFQRKEREVTAKEAAVWVFFWTSLALVFDFLFYVYCSFQFPRQPAEAWRLATEFFAGFLTEQLLSIDNLFVFILVFQFFQIPKTSQHRVLFFGILGAILFRGMFIVLGAYLMSYQWVIAIFGLFLIFTGIQLLIKNDEQPKDLEHSRVLQIVRKIIPITDQLYGNNFFIKQNGVWFATPLFLCLCTLELTDVIFAFDSVPAIFGLTHEPLVIFCSNILAVLGLRSFYFLLFRLMNVLKFLKFGLGLVLLFVGLKMTVLPQILTQPISIFCSLAIIVGLLIVSAMMSPFLKRL